MDRKYGGESMRALGQTTANVSVLSFPGSNPGSSTREVEDSSSVGFPKVDDHLVQPEVSREEVIRGRKIMTMGANPEHATAHTRADFLISPHVVDTHEAASDMLTRVNHGSNFATDVAVFKKGIDPATGARYLEELSFEVVNEQSASEAREKAEDLVRRGVRRVFGIFVKKGYVAEWSREKQDWDILPLDGELTDRLFIRPMSVGGLLSAAHAEMEVAKALWQKENPVLKKITDQIYKEGHKEGRKEGHKEGRLAAQRQVLLELLEEKFGLPSPEAIERVHDAQGAQVRAWTKAVLHANTIDEVLAIAVTPDDER